MRLRIPTEQWGKGDKQRRMSFCIWHPKVEAVSWTGHLHIGKKIVYVGYCCGSVNRPCDGCSGNFKKAKD